jgi:hypothetical protein
LLAVQLTEKALRIWEELNRHPDTDWHLANLKVETVMTLAKRHCRPRLVAWLDEHT